MFDVTFSPTHSPSASSSASHSLCLCLYLSLHLTLTPSPSHSLSLSLHLALPPSASHSLSLSLCLYLSFHLPLTPSPFHSICLCSWCCQSESVFATIGLNSQVKVHHIGHQKVSQNLIVVHLKRVGQISSPFLSLSLSLSFAPYQLPLSCLSLSHPPFSAVDTNFI